MGFVSRAKRRDLSRYETVYEDPDYEQLRAPRQREERITAGILVGGSTLETIGGLAAVILAILGFSQAPVTMAAAATIAIGLALLVQGVSVMSRWSATLRKLERAQAERGELVGGVSTETFGGIVGIGLAILALAGVQPLVMLPVAAIVYGGSLFLGGAAQPDLVYLAPERNPRFARISFGAIQASSGIMVLVGVASAVLGILALLEVGPRLTLVLAAMLSIGFALLFAGGVLTARFMRRFT